MGDSGTTIIIMSLFSELRRRNVFRVAATYAVVAWIIIEAGSVLLPTFGASESAFQTYAVVVIADGVGEPVVRVACPVRAQWRITGRHEPDLDQHRFGGGHLHRGPGPELGGQF